MHTLTLPYTLHAVSPVHFGTGTAISNVDLPVSREAANGLPNAPASGIRGVVRDALRTQYGSEPTSMSAFWHDFGAERDAVEASRFQAAISFSDALLLALPVHAFRSGFAWVSSPYTLARLQRWSGWFDGIALSACVNAEILLTSDSQLALPRVHNTPQRVVLGEQEFTCADQTDAAATVDAIASRLAKKLWPDDSAFPSQHFTSRFAIVSDTQLQALSGAATDVRTRVRIDAVRGGPVAGALWSEETLPSETLLWGAVMIDPLRNVAANTVAARLHTHFGDERLLAFGGKTTVGRGLAVMRIGKHEVTTHD